MSDLARRLALSTAVFGVLAASLLVATGPDGATEPAGAGYAVALVQTAAKP